MSIELLTKECEILAIRYNTDSRIEDISEIVKVNKVVDECPICHYSIKPFFILYNQRENYDYKYIDALYLCPRKECEKMFISYYKSEHRLDSPSGAKFYSLIEYAPFTIKEIDFDDKILKISPMFVRIYNQAVTAEQRNLDQICGLGYRKALEFLIKDYLISENKDNIDKIKRKPISQCISDYEIDARIKSTAMRATWLGNDEAHYERRWEKEDIDSLKTLIELTMHWIIIEISTKEFEERMKR